MIARAKAGPMALVALLAAFPVPAIARAAAPAPPGQESAGLHRTENIVLVTLDGVRIQEIFGGIDPVVANASAKRSGIYDIERLRKLYWRETPEARRAALWPYFWSTLAPTGVVLGDKEHGSHVTLRNPYAFSAPGYLELLTGQYQPDVTTNDAKRYPHTTVLEYARRALGLRPDQVALFATWDAFRFFASREEGAVFVNAGYERVPPALSNPVMDALGDYQMHVMALWEGYRTDMPTFHLALEYLKARRPRILYIALGETDDWAHARRYDRLLDCLHLYDEYFRILRETLESMDQYRDRTTLIVTTDHGRGVTPKDWAEHDGDIRGSEDIWLAILGPDTPDRGIVAPAETVYQADVAATLLGTLGLDGHQFNPASGAPIPAARLDGELEPDLRMPGGDRHDVHR